MTDNHKIVPAPPVEIEASDMHPLVRAATQGGNLDADNLGRLMDLQEQWDAMADRREANRARKEYNKAMVALKAKLPQLIDKDKEAGFASKKNPNNKVGYSFATMSKVWEIISPHLNKFGFSMNWIPSNTKDLVTVKSRLTHVGGHFEENELSGPPDNSGLKNPLQAIGSTQSYLTKYTSLALLGIVTRDMKCTDEHAAEKSKSAVSPDRNLKAVARLQNKGISVKEAEGYVQRDVKSWTTSDLDKLHEYYKTKSGVKE